MINPISGRGVCIQEISNSALGRVPHHSRSTLECPHRRKLKITASHDKRLSCGGGRGRKRGNFRIRRSRNAPSDPSPDAKRLQPGADNRFSALSNHFRPSLSLNTSNFSKNAHRVRDLGLLPGACMPRVQQPQLELLDIARKGLGARDDEYVVLAPGREHRHARRAEVLVEARYSATLVR